MRCRRKPAVPKLSPFCMCPGCDRVRAGWFTTWIAVLAPLAGVPVDQAITRNDDLNLLAIAVQRGALKGP